MREAGHGGMSIVYEAQDARIGRRVALKVVTVPPHLTAGQREAMLARLGREARTIARLSHPNIVSIYDIGEEDNRHFLVMEYLDGQTLRERLAHGPLPAGEASRILDQIAGALDAVHAEGVTHRDVKSSNVMLLPDGRAKLMDFGVARQVDDTMVTQAGMIVGSPVYMAPELIGGAEANAASDLWSLGVLLYEMLAGKPPFAGQTIPTVLYQVTHGPIRPVPGVTPAAQAVLTRALERDPARRYPSALALAAAFRAVVAPRPPRETSPMTPAGRRRAALLGLAALLAAALAGGTGLLRSHRVTAPVRSVLPARRDVTPAPVAAAGPGRARPAAQRPIARIAAARQERRMTPLRPHRRHLRPVAAAAPVAASLTAPAGRKSWRRRPRNVSQAFATPRSGRTHSFSHHTRHPVASPPGPRRFRSLAPEERTRQVAPAQTTSSGLLGTWHGTNTRNPATLTVTDTHPGGFDGVMTVRTHEALVRVAVTGRVSGGHVSMRETRVLSQSRPRAWDLGRETGRIGANGQMGGLGSDIKGRVGRWEFSR